MKKTKRLTRSEIEKQVEEAWQNMLKNNRLFEWTPETAKKIMRERNIPPETKVGLGLTVGMALGMGGMGKTIARQVKTSDQLKEVLRDINRFGEEMPTIVRKATKQMVATLPRRGGPGRRPKLNRKEASQMCDQIAIFIRQKNTLKHALQKASDLSPSILGGKKVSPRTLQKAWDRRDEFGS